MPVNLGCPSRISIACAGFSGLPPGKFLSPAKIVQAPNAAKRYHVLANLSRALCAEIGSPALYYRLLDAQAAAVCCPNFIMSHDEKDYYTEDKNGSLEKGAYATQAPVSQDDPKYHFDPHDLAIRPSSASPKTTSCPNIAGTIGTGLFLGSGKALARAGPAGALIAYIHVGSIAYSSLCAVGEMTCFAPISGSFPHFAARWVDPAFGFAVGWNYFYAIPVEVTAAQIILTFWDNSHTRGIVYTAIIMVLMCSINLFGVRYFGESEFFFAIIKLSLITGLILVGLVIDLGGGPDGDRRGFRYWKNPGAFNTYLVDEPVSLGRFLGILGVLIQAAFSFQGMELVAIAASETENPRRNIAKAVRRVFYRIVVFYVLGILVTGMIIPYNNEDLLQDTGTGAQSPVSIGEEGLRYGLRLTLFRSMLLPSTWPALRLYLTSLTPVFSLLHSPPVTPSCTPPRASCTVWPSEDKHHASSPGVQRVVFLSSRLDSANDGSTVFNWLVNLTTIGGFFTWWAINITYVRFYQGLNLTSLTGDMDFTTGIPTIEETESPELPPKNLAHRYEPSTDRPYYTAAPIAWIFPTRRANPESDSSTSPDSSRAPAGNQLEQLCAGFKLADL
ncbi:general APC amino acid permease [Rhizoctonia solani AG-1 IA]|uniref:General APC amino acid permease n=1 Tax=Thanatephorus cucumeris (strain AG1-IA) TaxID=983506 RepID=L8X452_THACA|nr:general APC amino acid permease [Rhizoctonia solani AG-1 IA]